MPRYRKTSPQPREWHTKEVAAPSVIGGPPAVKKHSEVKDEQENLEEAEEEEEEELHSANDGDGDKADGDTVVAGAESSPQLEASPLARKAEYLSSVLCQRLDRHGRSFLWKVGQAMSVRG